MQDSGPHDRHLVGWLSQAQLISWGNIFYTFALVMAPVERELGLRRAESSLAFSLALLAAPLAVDGQVWVVLLFVLLYGMGNGMLTISR